MNSVESSGGDIATSNPSNRSSELSTTMNQVHTSAQSNNQPNSTNNVNSAVSNTANDSSASQGTTSSSNSTATTLGGTSSNTQSNFIPLTRARMRENIDSQEVYDINKIPQAKGTHEAAKKARLTPYKLSEAEYAAFYEFVHDNQQGCDVYFYIRDRILELWYDNVQAELIKEEAFETLESDKLEGVDQQTIEIIFNRTFEFLDRTGRINFGLLDQKKEAPKLKLMDKSNRVPLMSSNEYKPFLRSGGKRAGRVIVMGAGLSGLMAARQLQRFGMEVIVLESRNRIGGRVHTYRKGNFIADLGPNSLNGITGNPMMVLGKQLELLVTELKQRIPIYENKVDKNGGSVCHQVDQFLERAIEREYNKIMEGTRVLKNNYKIEKYHNEPFPVGMAVDWVMKLQEKNIKDDQVKYLVSIEDLYKQLIESASKKLEKSRTIKKLHGELCSIKDSTDLGNHKDKSTISDFNRRCLARELDIAIKEYNLLLKQENEIHLRIAELTKSPPSDTYLTLSDRRLLDWHFAELEYALGCPINKLAIYYEDDEQIFPGNHWMLVHGFNTIVEAMKNDLEIMLNSAVRKITVSKTGCKVLVYNPEHPTTPYSELTADAVLCTLPLGTLKDSTVSSIRHSVENPNLDPPKSAQKGYQPVIFNPPLPKWKAQAFERLGCGNLNKIILYFDKSFWNHDLHLFGVVNHKAISRGEFFLFWHYGRTPTLTGLISGEAADIMEKFSDVEILERCLDVLRAIYGNTNVPAPRDYVVTRWRKDPWARGAWSYMQTGATGDDYDTCAEPVILESNGTQFKETRSVFTNADDSAANPYVRRVRKFEESPRLFFAGEHTTRYHFASAHGAVLTGLREAARIANTYLGCPYDNEDEEGIFTHVLT